MNSSRPQSLRKSPRVRLAPQRCSRSFPPFSRSPVKAGESFRSLHSLRRSKSQRAEAAQVYWSVNLRVTWFLRNQSPCSFSAAPSLDASLSAPMGITSYGQTITVWETQRCSWSGCEPTTRLQTGACTPDIRVPTAMHLSRFRHRLMVCGKTPKSDTRRGRVARLLNPGHTSNRSHGCSDAERAKS